MSKRKLSVLSSSLFLFLGCLTGCAGDEKETEDEPAHVHEFASLIAEKSATCTEDGMEAHYECSCGKLFNEKKEEVEAGQLTIVALGHDYGTQDYNIELSGHNLSCLRPGCNHVEQGAHDWIEHSKKNPTCTENGREKYFECSECHCYVNAEKTALVQDLTTLDIEKTGHNKGQLIPQTNPTCENKGMAAHYECTNANCNQLFNESGTEVEESDLVLTELGHDYAGSPIDFDLNDHWKTCQREGCEHKDKTPHKYNFVSKVFPTCLEDGCEAYYICNDCGAIANSDKTELTTLEDLKIEKLGHKADDSHWEFDGENHWHVCAHSGCEEILDLAQHDGLGYTNIVNTTSSSAGSFELSCSVCHANHNHEYNTTPTVEFNSDYSKATFTFTCESCKEDAPDHNFSIIVDTTSSKIEKGRLTPGGTHYEAEAEFLGATYSGFKDVLDDPYMWIAGSTGSDVAEMDRDTTTGNVILNAVLDDGDTTFELDSEYDTLHNKVNAEMVQMKFKVLSMNDDSEIWYVNQIDTYSGFGKEKMETSSTVTIMVKVGSKIIFRNGLKVEVLDVEYLDPSILYLENSIRTEYFGDYKTTRDSNGLINSFEYNTDGINDFCLHVGFSGEYIGSLYEKGYRSMAFDLTRTGGDLTRLIVMEGQTKHETYPANGKVTIDLYGAYPIYIDACANGGLAAKANIKLDNIVYGTALDSLSSKVISSEPNFWNYINHDYWGAEGIAPFGASKYGEYVVVKGCLNFLPNKLFSEAQNLGATKMVLTFDVKQDAAEGDNKPVQVVAMHGGGAFETPLNTLVGEDGKVTIIVNLKSYLFDIDGDLKLGLIFRVARNNNIYDGASASFKDSADAMNNVWFKVYAPTFLAE